MSGKTAASRSLDVKNSGDGTKNRFDSMANVAQDAPHLGRPLFSDCICVRRSNGMFCAEPLFQLNVIVTGR
jgi:hypothetical protein